MAGMNAAQLIDRIEGTDISKSAVEVIKVIKLLAKDNEIDTGRIYQDDGEYLIRLSVRTRNGELFRVVFDLE